MADFLTGGFKEIIDDPYIQDAGKVKKVVLCTGKIYFDISEKQQADKRDDVALVRLEQVYPLPILQLKTLREKYKDANWTWMQEEPKNMGALPFLAANLDNFPITFNSRPASASPATGFAKLHVIEQAALVEEALRVG